MPFELPIKVRTTPESGGDPAIQISTILDDVEYILNIRWNGFTNAWYLDVLDENEDPIRLGIKLVLGVPIGWRVFDTRWPPGLILISDLSNSETDSTFSDLGGRIRVYYYDEQELNALS